MSKPKPQTVARRILRKAPQVGNKVYVSHSDYKKLSKALWALCDHEATEHPPRHNGMW